MYHKIILVGNLGRDPEMRYTPQGQTVASFSMATSEKWKGQDEQLQERTIWWRVTVWGKQAENVNQYLKKGSKVLVEGRMQPDPKTGGPKIFDKSDGTKGSSYEVTALTVKFLSARGEGGAHAEAPASEGAPATDEGDDGIPF